MGQVVESVGDGNILHDIALVKNIRTGDGDLDNNLVLVLVAGDSLQRHLVQEVADLIRVELQSSAAVDVVDLGRGGARSKVGGDSCGLTVILVDDLNGLDTSYYFQAEYVKHWDGASVSHTRQSGNHTDMIYTSASLRKHLREGLGAVRGEHGNHGVKDNLALGQVSSRALNEDVLGIESDLGVVAVDDGGQGQDLTVLVVDDGVDGRVTDDGQELSEMLVVFVEGHQLLAVHALLLVQGGELNLLGGQGLVGEGTLDGVEIVGSNGDQSTLPANVHVELILQVDEVLVVQLGELDIPENSGDSEGANGSGLIIQHWRDCKACISFTCLRR